MKQDVYFFRGMTSLKFQPALRVFSHAADPQMAALQARHQPVVPAGGERDDKEVRARMAAWRSVSTRNEGTMTRVAFALFGGPK